MSTHATNYFSEECGISIATVVLAMVVMGKGSGSPKNTAWYSMLEV